MTFLVPTGPHGLVALVVGAVAVFAGLRMRGSEREGGGVATTLVMGGAIVLIIGLIIFGVAFAAGFGQGFQRGLNH